VNPADGKCGPTELCGVASSASDRLARIADERPDVPPNLDKVAELYVCPKRDVNKADLRPAILGGRTHAGGPIAVPSG